MAKQLRVRGGDLSEVVERAGRRIPRRIRPEVQTLLQAAQWSAHPKLAHRVNEKRLKHAVRRVDAFLGTQNPKAQRRGEILDVIAKIAFVVVFIVLAVFFTLLSRGYFA